MFKRSLLTVAAATLTAVGAAQAADTIKIDGSSTVYPISAAVAEEFKEATDSMNGWSVIGETRKVAPAELALRACSVVSTVPAPTDSSVLDANSAMSSNAPGVVSVNSTSRMPPSTAAFMASRAKS